MRADSFGKGLDFVKKVFLLLAPGSALEKFACCNCEP